MVGTAAPLRRRPSAATHGGQTPQAAGGQAAAQRPADAHSAADAAALRRPATRHSNGGARQDSGGAVTRGTVQRPERPPQADISQDSVSTAPQRRLSGRAPKEHAEDAKLLAMPSHPATGSPSHGAGEASEGETQHQRPATPKPAGRERGELVVNTASPGNSVSDTSASGGRTREQSLERSTDVAAAIGSSSVSMTQHERAGPAEHQTVVTADLRLTCSIPSAPECIAGAHAADGTAAVSSEECPQVGFRSLVEQTCKAYPLFSRDGAGSMPNTSS